MNNNEFPQLYMDWNEMIKHTQIERIAALGGKYGDEVLVYGYVYRNRRQKNIGIKNILCNNTNFPNVHFNLFNLQNPDEWKAVPSGQLVCVSGNIGYYDHKKFLCRKLCIENVNLVKVYDDQEKT